MGNCCVTNVSGKINKIIAIRRPSINNISAQNKLMRRESIYIINNENILLKYNFESELGSGYFGKVRLAFLKNDPNKKYAVKSIDKTKLSEKKIENLSREIEVLSTLDHPNIIRYYETYNDDEFFHIIMEYCSGGELFQRVITNKFFNEIEASSIIFKVVSGISHCHSIGIVHRDLKPENILYESKAEFSDIKLIDFGLSRKFMTDDHLHSVVGSPYYVAPEVLEGNYGNKCDIWGIGVLTYFLLCGQPPFVSNNKKDIFHKIKNEKVNFSGNIWKRISKEAIDLINMMLDKNPDKRPKADEILESKWFANQQYECSHYKIDPEIFENLNKFQQPKSLTQSFLKFIVKELNNSDIEKLKKAFIIMDEKKTGFLDIDQLKNCIIRCGLKYDEEDLKKMVKNCNFQTEKINYTSFIAAGINKNKLLDKGVLMETFKHFDTDGTGKITISGMEKALMRTGKTKTIEKLEEMFIEAGYTPEAKIDFEEFCNLLHRDIQT